MCGIAGVVFKDRKLHPVGDALTKMLDALQHRGPDLRVSNIWRFRIGKNEYILNIEVKEKPGLLEAVKNTVNIATPIKKEEIIPSVENYIIYGLQNWTKIFFRTKTTYNGYNKIDDVIVLNGAHSFEMIKDVGLVKDIAAR